MNYEYEGGCKLCVQYVGAGCGDVQQTENRAGFIGFLCTRPRGHESDHIACHDQKHIVARWPNVNPAEPVAETVDVEVPTEDGTFSLKIKTSPHPYPVTVASAPMTSAQIFFEWMRGCGNTIYDQQPPWHCTTCTEQMLGAMIRARKREEEASDG